MYRSKFEKYRIKFNSAADNNATLLKKKIVYLEKYSEYAQHLQQQGGANICEKTFSEDIISELCQNNLLKLFITKYYSEYDHHVNKITSILKQNKSNIDTYDFISSAFMKPYDELTRFNMFSETKDLKDITAMLKSIGQILRNDSTKHKICTFLIDFYKDQKPSEPLEIDLFRYHHKLFLDTLDIDDVSNDFKYFQANCKRVLANVAKKLNIHVLPKRTYIKTDNGIKTPGALTAADLEKYIDICSAFVKDEKYSKILQNLSEKNNTLAITEETHKKLADRLSFYTANMELANMNMLKDELNNDINIKWQNISNLDNEIWMLNDQKKSFLKEHFGDFHIGHYTSFTREIDANKIKYCHEKKYNMILPVGLIDIRDTSGFNSVKDALQYSTDISHRLKAHANMVYIDTTKKEIDHFEPHGIDGLYGEQTTNEIENDFKTYLHGYEYKYINNSTESPYFFGPQALDKSEYCYIHCVYYILLRIFNPLMTYTVARNRLLHDKDGKKLSGANIKKRMEKFMKAFRKNSETPFFHLVLA